MQQGIFFCLARATPVTQRPGAHGGPAPGLLFLGSGKLEAFALRLFASLRPAITAEVEASAWSGVKEGRAYEEVLLTVAAGPFK